MKKFSPFISALVIALVSDTVITFAQTNVTLIKQNIQPFAKTNRFNDERMFSDYFEFSSGKEVAIEEFENWLKNSFILDSKISLQLISKTSDKLGFVHFRYQQQFNNLPVENAVLIAHTQNNKVVSFNGNLYRSISKHNATALLSEKDALQKALNHVNAEVYKWQLQKDENNLKQIKNNANATYYPKGELVYAAKPAKNKEKQEYRLVFKFDIYADKPLKRVFCYVDASSGEIINVVNQIRHIDVTGTAITMYSGLQTIITDSLAPNQFRLRDYSRGGGVITLNDHQGTNDSLATDFFDTDNYWSDSTNHDNAATDAHWATEGTYDFYLAKFNRNSIDDNGLPLYGYVHNDSLQENAFWDGNAMHYGDGNPNGTFTHPFVCVDVIGHEITHGLTQYTAGLGFNGESPALNESFSDIMGTAIEHFLKPNTANYILGEDIGAIRSMSNPGQFNQPDTYLGTYWDSLSQEAHQNDGVQNYWFYLLAEGGSGVNDNGSSFNVSGIGIEKATQIAYRNLSVYLTPTSGYKDARTFAIIAAQDLYGNCSNEAMQTANAWYAVGLGQMPDSTTHSNFSVTDSVYCSIPATVSFYNLSSLVDSVLWDFGDGTTSTTTFPTHTYNSYGQFTVKLIAYGSCSGLADTLIKTNYITIDSTLICPTLLQTSDSNVAVTPTQTKCEGILLDNGGYGAYTSGQGIVTIAPVGAQNVVLHFNSFEFMNPDGIYIYDGADTNATLIGFYSSTSLPNGGTIISSGSSITIKQSSSYSYYYGLSGFEATWHCYQQGNAPVVFFNSSGTLLCSTNDSVNFTSASAGATSYLWDFGDGSTSTLETPPAHYYSSAGIYTVKFYGTNQYGTDSIIRANYIVVDTSSNCPYTIPTYGNKTVTRCTGKLFDSGGDQYYQDNTDGSFTIISPGATYITLTFLEFCYVDSAYGEGIYVHDGNSTSAPLIGYYTGFNAPNGGTVSSTGSAITIRQYSDYISNCTGFALNWDCHALTNGIASKDELQQFNVFPNPANDFIVINAIVLDSKIAELELTDILGNNLLSQKVELNGNSLYSRIPVSEISSGAYLLKVKINGTYKHIQKIIKS